MTLFLKMFVVLALPLTLFAVAPQLTQAHGAGMTLTSTSTAGQIIDVDYDGLSISANSSGHFGFNLFKDAARSKSGEFTDLWVRIVEDGDKAGTGRTLFAGGIHRPDYGVAGFVYVFPKAGKYTLHVRYNNSNKDLSEQTVAETSFPLDVAPEYNQQRFTFTMDFWLGFAIAAVIFALIGALFTDFFHRKHHAKT